MNRSRRQLDLGERFALPLAARFTRWLNGAILVLIHNKVSLIAWGWGAALVTSFIVTRPARASHGLWFDIPLILLFSSLFLLLAATVAGLAKTDWLGRLVSGGPEFSDLGGPPHRFFNLILRLHGEQRLELSEDDQHVVCSISDLDTQLTEEVMRTKYDELTETEPASDDEWAGVWRNTVRARKVGPTTYGETLDAITWQTLPLRIQVAQAFGLPLVALYQIFALWQLSNLAEQGSEELLTVTRSAVVVTLAASLIIFLNHTYNSAEIEIWPEAYTRLAMTQLDDAGVSRELRAAYDENIAAYQSRKVRPLSVELAARYHSLVRGHTAWTFAVVALLNAFVFVGLFAVAIPVTVMLGEDPSSDLRWMGEMVLGVLAMSAVLVVGLYFWLWVLEHRSRFAVLIGTALALTFLPPLFTYLAGGDAELSGRSALISAIVAAVVAAIVDLAKEYIARPAAARSIATR
jgi:hypothetical protein